MRLYEVWRMRLASHEQAQDGPAPRHAWYPRRSSVAGGGGSCGCFRMWSLDTGAQKTSHYQHKRRNIYYLKKKKWENNASSCVASSKHSSLWHQLTTQEGLLGHQLTTQWRFALISTHNTGGLFWNKLTTQEGLLWHPLTTQERFAVTSAYKEGEVCSDISLQQRRGCCDISLQHSGLQWHQLITQEMFNVTSF